MSSTFTLVRAKRALRTTRFQARSPSKPEYDAVLNKPYILHLLVRATCGKKVFSSNVSSRYLTCGAEPKVDVATFIAGIQRSAR